MEHRGWFINLKGSRLLTVKLRNFGLQQQELCRELLAAKQLGICKTTTSAKVKPVFKSLDSILKDGSDTIRIDIILTRSDPEEET